MNDEIVIYKSEDGTIKVDVLFSEETVWLTQAQMSELFMRDRSVITKHISNVFDEGELSEEGNVQFLHIANSDKPVKYYSLNVVISVGYRVKSPQGTRFRIWATQRLRDLLGSLATDGQLSKLRDAQRMCVPFYNLHNMEYLVKIN